MRIVSCVVVVILILAAVWMMQKGEAGGKQFDERQREVRGRGQKYGFFALVLCNLVYGAALFGELKLPVDGVVVIFCSLIVALTVQVCYNIWNDAYFALQDNKNRVMTGVGLVALCDVLNTWNLFRRGDSLFQIYACLAGALVLMFGAMLVHQAAERRSGR